MKKGDTVEGVITAIKPYGAFVKINDQMQGLIHISEISNHYVQDIHDYLTVGERYTLLVLNVKAQDKISLSYKRLHQKKKRLNIHLKTGFKPLKEQLPIWIDYYHKRNHEDKEKENKES